MNKRMLLGTTGAVALLWIGSASVATAGDANKQVRYRGDSTAQTVCMSIVYDDVKTLDRALRQKSNYYEARNVHLSYECNHLALNEFAFTQSAVEVGEYLAPMYGAGRVTSEQVSSINE